MKRKNHYRGMLVALAFAGASMVLSMAMMGFDIAQGNWHDAGMRGLVLVWQLAVVLLVLAYSDLMRSNDNLANCVRDAYRYAQGLLNIISRLEDGTAHFTTPEEEAEEKVKE